MKFNYVVAEVSACKGKMTGLASWIGLALSALVVGTAFGDDLRPAPQVPAGERYAYVRTFRVDGREVRLDDGETELDLAKIYPVDWNPGVEGTRWATVETTVESDADKPVRFYYSNDWFGELSVNGAVVKGDMGGPIEALSSLDIPVRKGANTISLRTRAGSGSWRCSFAFDGERRPGAADGEVDFTKTVGRIRPLLHSSGFGPQICSCPQSAIDEVRSMNFAAARTHDWALINPNERVCDYFHVFPLMKLDAKDPSNYHFGPTDYLLKRTREETGLDVFYRLGTSIEHSGEKVHFNTLIPNDFEKVAEIFAGTIRHYNRGWANGFSWGIRYWELWNEPDGHNNMWCLPDGDGASGSEKDVRRRELFVRFFVTCLKRLKSEFPEVKVGGPALCSMSEPYFRALLEGCRAAGVAPDFISWHYYGNSIEAVLGSVARARKLCDDMGFGACELVLNEWHYMGCGWNELRSADPAVQERVWSGPGSHNGTDSAAFTLSVLARFQTSALDQGYYYGCRPTGSWGYKDGLKRPYKVYYALKAFGEIVKNYPTLGEVKTTGSLTTLVAKSTDGRRTALLAVDYCGLPGDVVLETKGLPKGCPSVRVLDHTRDLEPVDVRVVGNRLVLPKRDRDSVSYLVTW